MAEPVRKQIRGWSEGSISALQDYFETTDWNTFRKAATHNHHADLQKHTENVMDDINKWIASVMIVSSRIYPRKAAGPDKTPAWVLRECAEQLKDVLTDVFNTSAHQAVVPKCLKCATIIPLLKKSFFGREKKNKKNHRHLFPQHD